MNPLSLEASDSLSDWAVCHSSCLMMDYRTNTALREDIMEMARMFPNIAVPFVIGSSTVVSKCGHVAKVSFIRSFCQLHSPDGNTNQPGCQARLSLLPQAPGQTGLQHRRGRDHRQGAAHTPGPPPALPVQQGQCGDHWRPWPYTGCPDHCIVLQRFYLMLPRSFNVSSWTWLNRHYCCSLNVILSRTRWSRRWWTPQTSPSCRASTRTGSPRRGRAPAAAAGEATRGGTTSTTWTWPQTFPR